MIILLWSLMVTVYGSVLTCVLFSNRYWIFLNILIVAIQMMTSILYFFGWMEIHILRNMAATVLGWGAFWIAIKLHFQWRRFRFLLKKYQEDENIILNKILNFSQINSVEFYTNIKLSSKHLLKNLNKQYNLIQEAKRTWLRLFLLWLLGWVLSGVGVLLLH